MYADGQRHDEKRVLSQLNQEFEAENLGSPMKVEMIARKLLWDLASQ